MHNFEEIKAMIEGGMTISGIAEELGVTPGRVSQLLSAMGLSGSVKRKSALANMEREQIDEAIRSYQNGDPVAAIIFRYGLSYNAFYKLLANEGIEMRERGVENRDVRAMRMERALDMYLMGSPIAQIEIETGIRQPMLHRELAQRNIPLRRRKSGFPGFKHILDELDMEEPAPRERELLSPEDDRWEDDTEAEI